MAEAIWLAWPSNPHISSELHVEALSDEGQTLCEAYVCGDEVRWIGEQPRKKPEDWRAAAARCATRARSVLFDAAGYGRFMYLTGLQTVPPGML
jgi:hypothetical protein